MGDDSDGDHQPLDDAKLQEFLREREIEVSRRLEAVQALDSEKGGYVNDTKSPRSLEPVAFAAPRIRHEKVDWEVPQCILDRLAQACDEDPQGIHARAQASKFAWSGVVDAAKAAWIGGTELLSYGELLPAGTEKALAVMAPGLHLPKRQHEVALELGCGRGRAALHLFLAGATVLGVELALERYNKTIENIERLAHRCPDAFRVSCRLSEFQGTFDLHRYHFGEIQLRSGASLWGFFPVGRAGGNCCCHTDLLAGAPAVWLLASREISFRCNFPWLPCTYPTGPP